VSRLYRLLLLAHHIFEMFCVSSLCILHVCQNVHCCCKIADLHMSRAVCTLKMIMSGQNMRGRSEYEYLKVVAFSRVIIRV
jgi:hypothetical protein